jgi:putative chitinase
MQLTSDLLTACTGANDSMAVRYAPHLDAAMQRFGITSPSAASCLLGQLAIESEGRDGPLSAMEEGLFYSDPNRLRTIFPSLFVRGPYRAEEYVRNPVGLSQLRYQGFHGRGLIQLTWRDTYAAAAKDLGFDYVAQPALVLQPMHAALTACWFFSVYKGCLPFAEQGDVYTITGLINGPARLKLAERKAVTAQAYRVLS